MDTLKEIIGLIDSSRFKQSDYLELNKLNTKTKFGQLYHGISSGKIQSDNDAAALIYNAKPSTTTYRKLKSRFSEKLLNTLLTLDFEQKSATALSKTIFDCEKTLMLAKILKANGCNHAAVKLIQSAWKKAENFRLFDILAQYANFLSIEYSVDGNINQYQKYQALYDKYSKESATYDQAKKLLFYTEALGIRKATLSNEVITKYKQAIKDIEKISAHTTNYHVHAIQFLILMSYYDRTHDYDNLISQCLKAEEFFLKNYGKTSSNLLITFAYLFKSYINTGRTKEGLELSNDPKINVSQGQFNWFKSKEYQIQFLLHSGHYEDAYHVLEKVKQNPQFKLQTTTIREKWNIIESYVYYVADVNRMEGILPKTYQNIRKRISATAVASTDKTGMNTSLLLLKYFQMLRDRQFDKLYDSYDAIKVYTNRYLKGEKNIRTYTIFKMLLELIKQEFDLHKNQVVPKLLDQLQKGPGSYKIIYEWEVVRYDLLWKMTVRT